MSSLTVNETQINFYQFIFNFLTISRRNCTLLLNESSNLESFIFSYSIHFMSVIYVIPYMIHRQNISFPKKSYYKLKVNRFVHYSNIWLSQFYQFDSKTNYFLMSFIFVKSKWLTAINKRRILVLSPLYICHEKV